jgi:hypothetical protein
MGSMPGAIVQRGGEYLLSLLLERHVVMYSEFYDGTEPTREKLRLGLGLSESDADWYGLELIVDLAVDHLVDLGVVAKGDVEELLADGEANYRIELTESGCERIMEGVPILYRDYDL